MRRAVSLAVALLLTTGLAAQAPKPPAPGATMKAAQGTWVVTTFNGQPAGEGSLSLTITGEKYAQSLNGTVNERGLIKIDAAKKPMTVDLTIQEGDDAGKVQLGLIDVAGDTMTLKLASPGGTARPQTMAVEEGFFVVVCKRQK